MHIGFITDEFPPDSAGGGIGTYLLAATKMLAQYGHDVEVFARSPVRTETSYQDGVLVHWIQTKPDEAFAQLCISPFFSRHSQAKFDVIEGTDYNGTASGIKERAPELPYVVKLHTPGFVVSELHRDIPTFLSRARMHIGAFRRGRLYRPNDFRCSETAKREISSIYLADEIASPSAAIADLARSTLHLRSTQISVFPYCFEPADIFLQTPITSFVGRIGFFGRLEVRKGILDLAHGFRAVVKALPHLKLRVVGRDVLLPNTDGRRYVAEEMRKILGEALHNVEFLGERPYSDIPNLMAECDVCVFPSHWESFGLVCCEAMASGRVVIGSMNGGMREILQDGECGILVPPHRGDLLAAAILRVYQNHAFYRELASRGRQRVLDEYSYRSIYPRQLASYRRAIARRTARCK